MSNKIAARQREVINLKLHNFHRQGDINFREICGLLFITIINVNDRPQTDPIGSSCCFMRVFYRTLKLDRSRVFNFSSSSGDNPSQIGLPGAEGANRTEIES